MSFSLLMAVLLAASPAPQASAVAEPPPAAAAGPDFDRTVLPVFEEHCTSCHSASEAEGDLVLETYDELMRGGEQGPALVAGHSAKSRLVMMIEGRAKPKMPPKKDLPADALAALKAWIDAARKRLHHNVLAIALANKLVRIAWAVTAWRRLSVRLRIV